MRNLDLDLVKISQKAKSLIIDNSKYPPLSVRFPEALPFNGFAESPAQ